MIKANWLGRLDNVPKLILEDDGESSEKCYPRFIEMVQVYYEEAERSLQGKGPKDEVVGNSSGTAHVKDPLGHEGMTVEIESALEGRSQVRRQCEQRKVRGRILWEMFWNDTK
nr:hypothetical protein [Tanacetum cinerariifolium]